MNQEMTNAIRHCSGREYRCFKLLNKPPSTVEPAMSLAVKNLYSTLDLIQLNTVSARDVFRV